MLRSQEAAAILIMRLWWELLKVTVRRETGEGRRVRRKSQAVETSRSHEERRQKGFPRRFLKVKCLQKKSASLGGTVKKPAWYDIISTHFHSFFFFSSFSLKMRSRVCLEANRFLINHMIRVYFHLVSYFHSNWPDSRSTSVTVKRK